MWQRKFHEKFENYSCHCADNLFSIKIEKNRCEVENEQFSCV